MQHQDTVLILQGGGALGAYQAGVYENLLRHDTAIDWVIGTSIGAINGAIIAGNRPQARVDMLRQFWDSLAPSIMPSLWQGMAPWMPAAHPASTVGVMLNGVDGFFKPRFGASRLL
ncbi:MAG: patatin-like phospholipase family protein [Pseudomonadota bacterium]